MTSTPKTSKKKYIAAGLVSGIIGAGAMAMFDMYNEEPFSIWKFVLFFIIVGGVNSYLQYRAQRNVDKNERHKFEKH